MRVASVSLNSIALGLLSAARCDAWSFPQGSQANTIQSTQSKTGESTRRNLLQNAFSATLGIATATTLNPDFAFAKTDCASDCLQSCKLIAPKDPAYCIQNCKEYCAQEDRTDGLSGSVSSDGGEKGILGINTVVKGEDKPPVIKLPGLDFNSEKGKKLLGY